MRRIKKRLTIVNRNNSDLNIIAMKKVVDRYVEKMEAKGWKKEDFYLEGDAFFQYEAYVYMNKGK